MDVTAKISSIVYQQNVFQALATTFAMTAYLFPPEADVCDNGSYDYIVVGGGSAGSVVATRLSEDPRVKVLLVEAGGDPPVESILPAYFMYLRHSKYDWNLTSVKDDILKYHKNGVSEVTCGKMLGGGSSINEMHYVVGNPEDFNKWARFVKDESWNYKNILPYLKKIENLQDEAILNSPSRVFHGTKGNIGVTKQYSKVMQKYLNAFKEMGYDVILDPNDNDTLGYYEPLNNMAQGYRQSTAYSYLGPAKNRSNLYVAKHTLATKVLFDGNNNAVAIEVLKKNGEKITLRANKEIILSAGSLHTPQLLMLSGIGPKKHLNDKGIKVISDLPVGENLQNHSPIVMIYTTEKAHPPEPTNPHEESPVVIGSIALNKSQTFPDYQSIAAISNSDSLLASCTFVSSFTDEICQKLYDDSKGKEVLQTYISPLHPRSLGRILLQSTNPLQDPLVYLNVYSNKNDLNDAISYVKDFNRVTQSSYFRRYNSKLLVPPQCVGLKPDSNEYWVCQTSSMVFPIYHYVGSCAMSKVVDTRLRVYGVKRLRVVDGSIIPLIPSGNTNAPIMMVGEKAADMIIEDNKRQ